MIIIDLSKITSYSDFSEKFINEFKRILNNTPNIKKIVCNSQASMFFSDIEDFHIESKEVNKDKQKYFGRLNGVEFYTSPYLKLYEPEFHLYDENSNQIESYRTLSSSELI